MSSSSSASGSAPSGSRFEVFFDSGCPLCAREIRFLKWMDRSDRIRFTDIAAPQFDARSVGRDLHTLMGEIHGRTADGHWIVGVEVFRRLYGAVGFGPVVRLSRWRGISWALDRAYAVFARNRLLLTGRCAGQQTCSIR